MDHVQQIPTPHEYGRARPLHTSARLDVDLHLHGAVVAVPANAAPEVVDAGGRQRHVHGDHKVVGAHLNRAREVAVACQMPQVYNVSVRIP